MSNYAKIKDLDEKSLQKLKEGKGPVDQCICSLLSEDKRSVVASIKKALKVFRKGKNSGENVAVDFNGKGIYSKKEVIKRKNSCGKCGCDDERIVLKHSYANIRITSPDVSSICPCSSNCLPDKEKLKNNIQVIVEHANIINNKQNEEGVMH